MALRLRRGTDAERALITPLAGELIYVTDTRKVYVGDGVTPGGISIDSGALEINDLTDVNTSAGDSTQPADGEVLTWSADNARWEPGAAASGGSTTLNGLTDVEVTGISTTSALVYDTGNSRWEATQFLFSNLGDTFISGTPTTGQVLKWNGFAWAAANDELGDSLTLTNITDVYIPSTPSTGQVLKWNGSVWTNQNEVTDTGITAISQDTNPALGGNLNASGFNINSAGTITATTFSGSGASLTNLNILTDTSPQLGGNLDLNGRNITGSGNIVINNNIQGDVILGNTIAGRFYGDLTGSVFADDSAIFYDSINHVASVDTLIAGTSITTPQILSDTSTVEVGTPDDPKDFLVYTTTSDAIFVYKASSTYAGYSIRNSAGTIDTPLTQANGDVVGSYTFKSWDGTQYTNTGIIASVVDGTVSAGIAPGKLQLASYDASGNPNIMEYDATGTLTPGNITVSGKLNVTAAAPGNATDTGTVGEIRVDADFIYVCTASNTWKRVAIATWP